jgi:ATP-dependent DNA helicase DinG
VAAAPLSVSGLLEGGLFSRLKSAVLTSATLTVAGDFHYHTGRLGLDGGESHRVDTARYSSPFDFESQALVAAPSDLVDPQEVRFAEQLASLVERAVQLSRGRAFVLFTAYGLLTRTHARLADRLSEAGLVPMRQGELPRDVLLERFRASRGGVLFATQSFWEGVDVPGDALSLVVLTRLPFRVPSEPLQEARVEAIERAGGDPFSQFSLPQAVIRFRQGFGRLIRTRSDRGVVLVADSRVIRKRYGQLFLRSLPEVRVVAGPRRAVLDAIRVFFSLE